MLQKLFEYRGPENSAWVAVKSMKAHASSYRMQNTCTMQCPIQYILTPYRAQGIHTCYRTQGTRTRPSRPTGHKMYTCALPDAQYMQDILRPYRTQVMNKCNKTQDIHMRPTRPTRRKIYPHGPTGCKIHARYILRPYGTQGIHMRPISDANTCSTFSCPNGRKEYTRVPRVYRTQDIHT